MTTFTLGDTVDIDSPHSDVGLIDGWTRLPDDRPRDRIGADQV
jgi:hypothetical protein